MIYSVGIIGLGNVGIGYDLNLDPSDFVISHARAFAESKYFSVAFGVDCDQARRVLFSEKYEKAAYKNIQDALVDIRPDIIVICNPTSYHLETVLAVLQIYNPTAILCEKPMGLSFSDAERIVRACNDCNVKIYVNYLRRSDDGINEIKYRIDQRIIEHPVRGIVWYGKGWIHSASHFFNMLELWLGKVSQYSVLGAPQIAQGGEKNILVNVSFEKGDITFLYHPNLSIEHYLIEIHALNGQIIYGDGLEGIHWTPISESRPNYQNQYDFSVYEEILVNRNKCQLKVVDEMWKALQNENSNICSGHQALTTLKVMYEILEAA